VSVDSLLCVERTRRVMFRHRQQCSSMIHPFSSSSSFLSLHLSPFGCHGQVGLHRNYPTCLCIGKLKRATTRTSSIFAMEHPNIAERIAHVSEPLGTIPERSYDVWSLHKSKGSRWVVDGESDGWVVPIVCFLLPTCSVLLSHQYTSKSRLFSFSMRVF